MEEYVLSFFFTGEELNVVDNQNIYHLIEMNEVVGRLILDGIDELMRKLLGLNVKHSFVREIFLDGNTDGMRKVCFSETNTAV